MVHGAVRKLFQLFGALVAGLLIALPLVAWRLASGPIALDFLTPTIEEALSAKGGGLTVDLDTTVLAFAEHERLVEIRAMGVRVFAGGETPVATLPEVALTLSGRALVKGVIAPKSVRLYKPRLRLVRDEQGKLTVDIGEQSASGGSDDVVRSLIDALVGAEDPSQPGRHLQRASIIDADLQVEDLALGMSWHAPDTDVHLIRTREGLAASATLGLDLGGEVGSVGAEIAYVRETDAFTGELTVAGLRPALFARLGGMLTPLAAVDMPLAGSVTAKGTADGRLDEVTFDLAGGEGRFHLDEPVPFDHAVAGVHLRGGAFDGLTRARLDEFHIDLGGPTITLAAVADGLGGTTTVKAEAVLRDVPFDSLPALWP